MAGLNRQHPALLLLIAVFLVMAVSADGSELPLEVAGTTESIEFFQLDEITYFSLSDLAEYLGGQLDWKTVGHEVTYKIGLAHFRFLIDSPFYRLGDSLFNATYPAVFRDGHLFLPASSFLPTLNQVLPQEIVYDQKDRRIRIDSQFFNVTDLAVMSKANGLLIEIFLTSALAYDIFITEGNWLNISIRDGRINAPHIRARRDRSLMYNLKVHQAEQSGQISMRLKRPIDKWHHRLAVNPPRIQISIADADFELETPDTSPIVGADNKIDVIVIDPGHGGKDYGAIGPGKTREKDVVLKIAKELAKLIRKDKQFKVIMTRDRDEYISLDRRAEIANEAGADLFISIHANASPKRTPRGWNVFFLAPARNDSARAVAQFENSFFLRERQHLEDAAPPETGSEDTFVDPILSILNEMIMTEFQTESHEFAMMCDKEFRRHLKIPARGVDQAGFFVLNRVYTPSVLIESGFISNHQEEKILKSGDHQKAIAKALYNSIKRFKAKYEDQ